ncbi:hypothetical protein ScPMuIL_010667 [Solemya velum]
MASNDFLLVAAIDFGTTYSGYAFSFKHENERDPMKISANNWGAFSGGPASLKTPTTVLLTPDEQFFAFGYEAEDKYAELALDEEHEDWFYFRRFKMMLFEKIGLKRNITLEDDRGRNVCAQKVFSMAIRFLKNHLLGTLKKQGTGINESDIHWVVTVPAIWNDAAKQFMREASEKAGLTNDQLTVALEPEAASLYCKTLPIERVVGIDNMSLDVFTTGTKYMVLDAGGGTVDITVHEVVEGGALRELHKASGGAWGGTRVDEAFRQLMIKLVGNDIITRFSVEHKADFVDMLREFELKKQNIREDSSGKITIRIPITLRDLFEATSGEVVQETISQTRYSGKIQWKGDRLRVEASVMKSLFQDARNSIFEHIDELFGACNVSDINTILMVGGFSESPLLQAEMRQHFPNKRIVIPQEAGLAVLKGAVLFGHHPTTIVSRIAKFTYGIAMHLSYKNGKHDPSKKIRINGVLKCKDVFSKHVEKGQILNVGEVNYEHYYTPLEDNQKEMALDIYTSTEKDPCYVTDSGSTFLGQLMVKVPNLPGGSKKVWVRMTFGGTEMRVEARDDDTDSVTKAIVALDFGTAYSGYAFSFRNDFEQNHLDISANQWRGGSAALVSLKTPTCCLFSPDGKFHSFGFKAEDKYADLALEDEHENWFYFRRFKMKLYKAFFNIPKLSRDTTLVDENGKSMSALKVFGASIGYLRKHMVDAYGSRVLGIDDVDVKWVLTVPAIWDEAAKQFMREAAELGGIPSSLLSIALEPEAASFYCQEIPLERLEATEGVSFEVFKPGSRYLVLDAGGGTIDITVHEVQKHGKLRELKSASGGNWGGTTVDATFQELLTDLVGHDVWRRFCVENKSDLLDIYREFETKKRVIMPDLDKKFTIRMPISLVEMCEDMNGVGIRKTISSRDRYAETVSWIGDKLRLDACVVKGLFGKTCEDIIGHLRDILDNSETIGISAILMVGGFSESKMLQHAVRSAFPALKVIIPSDAGLAVLKGAVIFGFKPNTIITRVSKYTYGIKIKRAFIDGSDPSEKRELIDGQPTISGIFDKHIECEQEVKEGESLREVWYTPTSRRHTGMRLKIFSSPNKCPEYVSDDGCKCLGEVSVGVPRSGGSVVVKLVHGGTELGVDARDETGAVTKATFDFLG